MQKAPVLKGSGLAPIDDEPAHVFGKNLEARVVEAHEDDDKEDRVEAPKHNDEEDVANIKKRKFDTITGEENEETVFQGEFKLFVWDVSSSNWIEKGRGQLKLNDDLDEKRSRLIMRIGGTFRIILNVAIRHSLFKVISTSKTSIRFSDCQNVWAASGSNAKQLGDLLNERINAASKRARESSPPTKENKDTENVGTETKGGSVDTAAKNGGDDTKVSKRGDDELAKNEGDSPKAVKDITVASKESDETVARQEGDDTIGSKESEGQEQDEKQSDDSTHNDDDDTKQNPEKEKPEEAPPAESEDKKIP